MSYLSPSMTEITFSGVAVKEYLSRNELAVMLGVSRSTTWRMQKEGKLPNPVIIGKSNRWRKSEIDQLFNPVKKTREPSRKAKDPVMKNSTLRISGKALDIYGLLGFLSTQMLWEEYTKQEKEMLIEGFEVMIEAVQEKPDKEI